jgi:hypothetical protein
MFWAEMKKIIMQIGEIVFGPFQKTFLRNSPECPQIFGQYGKKFTWVSVTLYIVVSLTPKVKRGLNGIKKKNSLLTLGLNPALGEPWVS